MLFCPAPGLPLTSDSSAATRHHERFGRGQAAADTARCPGLPSLSSAAVSCLLYLPLDAADAAGLARKVARLKPVICIKG